MRPLARSQPRANTTATKPKRPTYMMRAHDARVAEVPHLGVRAQRKVKLAQHDYTPHEAACQLRDESRSICIVSAAMDSETSWGRAGSRRGYNLSHDDGISFHDRDGWRERTRHMRRPSAPRWDRSIPFVQRYSASIPRHSRARSGSYTVVYRRVQAACQCLCVAACACSLCSLCSRA